MSFQCSALCLTAAHDLIGHINTHFRPRGEIGMLPAWWYCIFCEYRHLVRRNALLMLPIRYLHSLHHSSHVSLEACSGAKQSHLLNRGVLVLSYRDAQSTLLSWGVSRTVCGSAGNFIRDYLSGYGLGCQ